MKKNAVVGSRRDRGATQKIDDKRRDTDDPETAEKRHNPSGTTVNSMPTTSSMRTTEMIDR